MGISASSIDGDTGLELSAHVYVEEAGDYYSIDDGVESYTSHPWREGGWKRMRRSH